MHSGRWIDGEADRFGSAILFSCASFAKTRTRDGDGFGREIVPEERAAELHGSEPDGAGPHEGVRHAIARRRALANKHLADVDRLLRRISVADARRLNDIGDSEIRELALALLKEEDKFVGCSGFLVGGSVWPQPAEGRLSRRPHLRIDRCASRRRAPRQARAAPARSSVAGSATRNCTRTPR
jgi:hypothetical protein